MTSCYNGMICKGDCSKKPEEIRNPLQNWYQYDF